MTSRAPAGSLERSYRRLLACYPPQHRRAHGEEMLGVLVTAAAAGQRRATWRETADPLRGATRIWLAPRCPSTAEPGWRDALAVVSLGLPLIMALKPVAETAALEAAIYPQRIYASFTGGVVSFSALSPGLVILLVVLRLRRTAAVVTLVLTAELLVAALAGAEHGLAATDPGSVIAFMTFGYAVETVALACSAGPRRGLRLLTARGVAVAVTGTVAVAVACAAVIAARMPVLQLPRARQPVMPAAGLSATAAAAGVILLAVAVTSARSVPGRRVMLLLAIPACVLPAGLPQPWPGAGAAAALSYLPPLALAAGTIAAARRPLRPRAS